MKVVEMSSITQVKRDTRCKRHYFEFMTQKEIVLTGVKVYFF